jgi:hypothetical protein
MNEFEANSVRYDLSADQAVGLLPMSFVTLEHPTTHGGQAEEEFEVDKVPTNGVMLCPNPDHAGIICQVACVTSIPILPQPILRV